jgi:MerR family mercuric resistance operon transcriptional regulator
MQASAQPTGGIRHHGDRDLIRLHSIKSAQRLGFCLNEIGDLLRFEDGSHCNEARERAARKLTEVCARIADLGRIEAALQEIVERCCATSGDGQYPLIVALQGA